MVQATDEMDGCDVLVVGAGPVGLTLAGELRRRGVTCRVLDRADGPATSSRALGTHARTLELFQQMGLMDRLAPRGQHVNHFAVYEGGQHLTTFDLDYTQMDTPFDYSLFVGQAETEAVLRDHLRTEGGEIAWGVRLDTLTQDADGVTATAIATDGTRHTMRARWLVGCDGGHSTVRKLLALPFEGASDETWFVVDAQIDVDLSRDSIHMLRSLEGSVVLFPFPEPGKWRILDTAPAETEDAARTAAHFSARISGILRQTAVVHEPTWASVFTIQQRAVPRLRVGRCFVAGDAAHVHSPASGRGLNTGVQDAFNLAWKLALVVHGDARAELLDSYTAERWPVSQALLRGASTATRLLSPRSPWLRRAGGRIVQVVTGVEPIRRVLSRRITKGLSGLTINYRTSPLTDEAHETLEQAVRHGGLRGARAWRAFRAGPRPGDRVPEVRFGDESLFSVLNDTRHTLLLFAGLITTDSERQSLIALGQTVRARYGRAIAVRLVLPAGMPQPGAWDGAVLHDDMAATLHRRFGVTRPGLSLIRPDWYVGYRSPRPDAPALDAYLARVFVARNDAAGAMPCPARPPEATPALR